MRSQAKIQRSKVTKVGKVGEARVENNKVIIKVRRTRAARYSANKTLTFEVYSDGTIVIDGIIRVRRVGTRKVIRHDSQIPSITWLEDNNLYEVEYIPTGKKRLRRASRIDIPIDILNTIAEAVREGEEYIVLEDYKGPFGKMRRSSRLFYFAQEI